MYLKLLKEKEKALFLKLAYGVSLLDGDYGEAEQQMIDSYCEEMKISNSSLDKKINLTDIVKEIEKECDIKSKRIIIFEIIGLAMADGKYDIREKKYIYELIEKLNLSNEYGIQCENFILEYISSQEKINTIVIG